MQLNYIITGIVLTILNSITAISLAWYFKNRADTRSKTLWKLFYVEAIIFPVFFLVPLFELSLSTPFLLLSLLVYSLVGTYVITLEIPGFLLLSAFDTRSTTDLSNVRQDLVTLGYSFEALDVLSNHINQAQEALEFTGIRSLLNELVTSSMNMKNLNKAVWEIALSETTNALHDIASGTKHPFPKLIDIFSLAGLSFLLAQFILFLK